MDEGIIWKFVNLVMEMETRLIRMKSLDRTDCMLGHKHIGFENDEKYHGTYTAAPLQQDGKIVTANGAGNAMTVALYLLAALQGEEKALEVARSIQMKL